MSDPKLEELVKKHDTVEAVEEALEEEAPPLPQAYQSFTYEEILDLEATKTTELQTRMILDWMMFQRRKDAYTALARERFEDDTE